MLRDLTSLLADASRELVEPRKSYREFCNEVIVPDGDLAGQPLNPDRHPAQSCIVAALDGGYRKIVIAKPVQDGGSLILTMPLLRRAVRDGQTVIIAYPTLDSAKDIWTTKIWPILSAFGGQEPRRGGGSRGGAARVVTLPGGGRFVLRQAGGRKESAQASVTGDAIEVDEVDDWPDLHRVELIGARISRAPDPLQLYVSTVKRDEGSLILLLYSGETATGSHLEYPCMHCGAFQRLSWEFVDLDTSTYTCQECSKPWREPDRLASLEHWKRVDARPHAPAFSLMWTGLESPFPILVEGRRMPVLPGLVAKYQRAMASIRAGDHGPMRSFRRDHLTSTYEEPAPDGAISNANLAQQSARSQLHKRLVPSWATSGVLACDVQHDRIYWLLYVHNADKGAYIDWGYEQYGEKGAPNLGACLDLIEALADEGWQQSGAEARFSPAARAVDVGDQTDKLLHWLGGKPKWIAVRGAGRDLLKAGGEKLPLPDHVRAICEATQPQGWRRPLYHVHGHNCRTAVHAGLLRDPETPNSIALVCGLIKSDMLILHLSGEVWEDPETPGERPFWREVRKRHDLLDCAVYAYGVSVIARHLQQAIAVRSSRRYGVISNATPEFR